METPKLDEQIMQLSVYERNDEISENGKEMLIEFRAIKEQLRLHNVVGQSEQLVCPECGSDDLKTAIHTDYKECNKCYHYWAN